MNAARKTFFFYDVKCKETTPGSGACADIKDLDPGTLLDNGRRDNGRDATDFDT